MVRGAEGSWRLPGPVQPARSAQQNQSGFRERGVLIEWSAGQIIVDKIHLPCEGLIFMQGIQYEDARV